MDANIIKLAKSMKKEYVYITAHYILGADLNWGTLSIIYTGSEESYIGTVAELEGMKKPEYADCVTVEMMRSNFQYLHKRMMTLTNVDPVVVYDNITESKSFLDSSRNLKAKDGAKMFKYKERIMFNFSSLHPVNKSDEIYITIYPVDDISFLANFIVDKKKYKIYEYIRYLSV